MLSVCGEVDVMRDSKGSDSSRDGMGRRDLTGSGLAWALSADKYKLEKSKDSKGRDSPHDWRRRRDFEREELALPLHALRGKVDGMGDRRA